MSTKLADRVGVKTSGPVPHDANVPAHHWLIEEANGPVSVGVCKVCGAFRQFKTWLPETDFTTRSEHEFAA